MKAVVVMGERKFELVEFADPAPGPGEVVLESKASGMGGSDLKFCRAAKNGSQALGLGPTSGPVIAGHEPCGVVVAVGSGVGEREAPIGSRVMVHHYKGCGVCPHCRVGWWQLCAEGILFSGVTGHGAHSRSLKVPPPPPNPLPDALSLP